MITRLTLLTSAVVLSLGSFAQAGPVGRDMDRDREPTVYASAQALNPADISFEVRQEPRFDRESPPSSCYQLIAVDKAGNTKIVEPCMSNLPSEIDKATERHMKALREAYAEGRRIIFAEEQQEIDRAEKRNNQREDRR